MSLSFSLSLINVITWVSLSQGDRGTTGSPGVMGEIGIGFPGSKVTITINNMIDNIIVVVVLIVLILLVVGYNTRQD